MREKNGSNPEKPRFTSTWSTERIETPDTPFLKEKIDKPNPKDSPGVKMLREAKGNFIAEQQREKEKLFKKKLKEFKRSKRK